MLINKSHQKCHVEAYEGYEAIPQLEMPEHFISHQMLARISSLVSHYDLQSGWMDNRQGDKLEEEVTGCGSKI